MSTFFTALGALAMETLHRQVLPFILRRLKEDVLQDLPPKIIQDYYCDLSPLQVSIGKPVYPNRLSELSLFLACKATHYIFRLNFYGYFVCFKSFFTVKGTQLSKNLDLCLSILFTQTLSICKCLSLIICLLQN